MPQKTKKHLLLPLLLIFYLLSPVISFAETKKPLNQSKLKSQSNPPRFIIIQHSYSQNPANINMGELKGGNIEIIKEFTIDNVYNILLDKHHLPGNELFFTRSFRRAEDGEHTLMKLKFSLKTGEEELLGFFKPYFDNFNRAIKFYEVEDYMFIKAMPSELLKERFLFMPEKVLQHLKNPRLLEDFLENGYFFNDFQLSSDKKTVSSFVTDSECRCYVVIFPFIIGKDSSSWDGKENDFRPVKELIQLDKDHTRWYPNEGFPKPSKCWSPDGKQILFSRIPDEKNIVGIYTVDVEKPGSPLLKPCDVYNWEFIFTRLKYYSLMNKVLTRTRNFLDKESLDVLKAYPWGRKNGKDFIKIFTKGLNKIITNRRFYDEALLECLVLDKEGERLRKKGVENLSQEELLLFNRKVLTSIFVPCIRPQIDHKTEKLLSIDVKNLLSVKTKRYKAPDMEWTENGIVITQISGGIYYRLTNQNKFHRLKTPDEITTFSNGRLSPDGKMILFLGSDDKENPAINLYIRNLKTGKLLKRKVKTENINEIQGEWVDECRECH